MQAVHILITKKPVALFYSGYRYILSSKVFILDRLLLLINPHRMHKAVQMLYSSWSF